VRAFLAAVPPRPARNKIEEVRDPLRELATDARWVHPSLWHLTLKFLGEVEDELVPAVADLAGEVAQRFDAFEVVMSGLSLFPNRERPRVLVVGITQGAEPLTALAKALDDGLDGLGFEPETRPYNAHLTIARFREARQVGELSQHLGETAEIVRFWVDEISLMKSVLRPRGPDYTQIEALPLIPREKTEEELAAEAAADAGASEADAAESTGDGDES
jgi:2'-5' RNA ligase